MGGPAYVGGRYLQSTDNFLVAPFRFPCVLVVKNGDGAEAQTVVKQEDVEWKTCEHLFQAMKFGVWYENRDHCRRIQQADGPMEAWRIGQSRKHAIRTDWEAIKGHAMYLAVRAKYDQYPEHAKALANTYNEGPIRAAPSTSNWEYLNSMVLECVRLELKMEQDKKKEEESACCGKEGKEEEELSDAEWDKKQRQEMAELAEYKRLCRETSLPPGSDPIKVYLDRTVFSRPSSNAPMDVEMCKACSVLYSSTGSLFVAIHRLPDGGEMYLPMVSALEHVVLTFLSRVKAQVANICDGKTALRLLLDKGKGGMPSFSSILERRGTFTKLMRAYESSGSGPSETSQSAANESKDGGLMPLSPPAKDTEAHYNTLESGPAPTNDEMENPEASVEREETIFSQELIYLRPFFDFLLDSHRTGIVMCTDEELTKSACLAHSLLKVSSLLEKRLQVRGFGCTKTLSSTRALREAIKTLKMNGIKMSKFCRIDMLLQTITKLSKICKSSTLIARDAVRIPSSVNELGEYMTGSSDYLREAAGNAVTAYTFSCLEQYIPLCLMETVRVIASGEGIILKAPLTMNGIEALDRSGSVLYRDLKGATSFDNSFWDVELAAVSFERSASLIAMMELEMEELCAFYSSSPDEFSEEDFELMFSMDGPRRRGDLGRYRMLKQQLGR